MILKRTNTELGYQPKGETEFTGLLGMIQHKKFDILPKVETYFPNRSDILDYSTVLWKDE